MRLVVVCDDGSHAPRRVRVGAWRQLPSGGWSEEGGTKQSPRTNHVGSGQHMLGDAVAEDGWALDTENANADLRTHYVLACERTPQCRRRPVPARGEHLDAALSFFAELGVSEVALSTLGATLQERAQRKQGGP
jgi:hypothetical protein